MSVPAGFDPRDAVAVNPSVTNHRPLRASVSQNNPVNCCFLDKPALSWTNSVAALQDHLFDRAKWLNATAMPKRKNHSRAEIARKLAQANRLGRQGKLHTEIARKLGVSVMTLHRWCRALLRARPAHETDQRDPTCSGERIAQLQFENSLLRRLVTDLLLHEKINRRHQRPS